MAAANLKIFFGHGAPPLTIQSTSGDIRRLCVAFEQINSNGTKDVSSIKKRFVFRHPSGDRAQMTVLYINLERVSALTVSDAGEDDATGDRAVDS